MRGVAVIVMIVVHCLAYFASVSTQTDSASFVLMDIGKLTAVFIVCMGVSSGFSRRRAPRDLVRRGVEILLWGYGLNVFKFLVPLWAGTLPDRLITELGWQVGASSTAWGLFALGDILHLVGLSLLLVAGLRALGARPWLLCALAAAIAAISPLVWGVRGGGPLLAYVCDLCFGDTYTVFFPVFPWAAYVLFGFALGDALYRSEVPPAVAFARWARFGAGLVAAGVGVGVASPTLWKGADFYRTGPAGVVAVIGFSLVALWFADKVWPVVPQVVRTVWAYASRRVTRLYLISWGAIAWLLGWVGFMTQDDGLVLAGLTALVFAITVGVDAAIDLVTARRAARATRGSAETGALSAPRSPARPASLAG